jgi:hypothetical protein
MDGSASEGRQSGFLFDAEEVCGEDSGVFLVQDLVNEALRSEERLRQGNDRLLREQRWRRMVEAVTPVLARAVRVHDAVARSNGGDGTIDRVLEWTYWDRDGSRILRELLSLSDLEFAKECLVDLQRRGISDEVPVLYDPDDDLRFLFNALHLFSDARQLLRRGGLLRYPVCPSYIATEVDRRRTQTAFLRPNGGRSTAQNEVLARRQVRVIAAQWLRPFLGVEQPASETMLVIARLTIQKTPEACAKTLMSLWKKPRQSLWALQAACRLVSDSPALLEDCQPTDAGRFFLTELQRILRTDWRSLYRKGRAA